MSRPSEVWNTLLAQLRKEPRVTWLGLLGVTLGVLCTLIGLASGFQVAPEGNLWETATFNAALGVFHLTQATLVPEAGFTQRGQRRWGTALVIATLYAYGIETVHIDRRNGRRVRLRKHEQGSKNVRHSPSLVRPTLGPPANCPSPPSWPP